MFSFSYNLMKVYLSSNSYQFFEFRNLRSFVATDNCRKQWLSCMVSSADSEFTRQSQIKKFGCLELEPKPEPEI